MKFAYKVWHSEADKRESRKLEGQQLVDDEVAAMHERLHELVSVNYEVEPAFSVSVITLSPSWRRSRARKTRLMTRSHAAFAGSMDWTLICASSLNRCPGQA